MLKNGTKNVKNNFLCKYFDLALMLNRELFYWLY